VQGTMDRVIWVYQGNQRVAADIIDFKSDVVDDAKLQSRIEHYRPQMEVYRRAVSRFAKIPIECIATRLVFSHPRQVINLELIESKVGHSPVPQLPKESSPKESSPKESRTKESSPKESRTKESPTKLPVAKQDSPEPLAPKASQQKTLWD
jgi:hypothetical protein